MILDDELIIRKSLEEQMRRKRLSAISVGTMAEAEKYLAREEVDLIFLDVNLPDGNGTDLLDRLAGSPDGPLVVVITGYGTVESAVSCMRAGAFDYIIKPFSNSQIDVLLKKAQSYTHLVKVNQFLHQEMAGETELIGHSAPLQRLRQLVAKVAPTEATVLISGENGTGKEMVANELYRLGARRRGPFIRVNCAAISESLIESEFFGHEKGAFTGALQKREGRFELADGGTILLDEISEISPKVQAKLLRVLQEREFERVGGNKTIQVNVRVVATTNRDLLKLVEAGEFRQDLYYRLNVFPVHVPPLRERQEDIPLLARHFLERFGRKHGIKVKGIEPAALEALVRHSWPGNVRELQNTLERAVILSETGQPLQAAALGLVSLPASVQAVVPPVVALPSPVRPDPESGENGVAPTLAENAAGEQTEPDGGEVPPVPLAEVERRHILDTLRQTGGNRTQAANALGVSIRTLRNKLALYRQEGLADEFVETN